MRSICDALVGRRTRVSPRSVREFILGRGVMPLCLLLSLGLVVLSQLASGSTEQIKAGPAADAPVIMESWDRSNPSGKFHVQRDAAGLQDNLFHDVTLADRTAQNAADDEAPEIFDPEILHSIVIDFESDSWREDLKESGGFRGNSEDLHADITIDGIQLSNIGVRVKGVSTAIDYMFGNRDHKPPLNLTFDAFEAGQDHQGFDIINLNNNLFDPTMLREALALDLLRNYMPAQRSAFAKVIFEDEFQGVYLMTEQIERTFIGDNYESRDGFLFKGEPGMRGERDPEDTAHSRATLNWAAESLIGYQRRYALKTSSAGDEAYEALREAIRALDAPPESGGLDEASFADGIHAHFDVDSALWHLASNVVLAHLDSYYNGHNFFVFRSDLSQRFELLNWDLNLTFGRYIEPTPEYVKLTGIVEDRPLLDLYFAEDYPHRPLVSRLLAVDEFRADYEAHIRTMRDQLFNVETMEPKARRWQELISAAVREEPEPDYSHEGFIANLNESIERRENESLPHLGNPVLGVLPFVAERHQYLSDHSELVPSGVEFGQVQRMPEQVTLEDAVRLRVEVNGPATIETVELRYRVSGAAEVRVLMQNTDGRFWEAEIPAQPRRSKVRYVFRAGTSEGRAEFFPQESLSKPFEYRVAGIILPREPAGDLVLNELIARNRNGHADESGAFEDWVELYNRGSAPVELAGHFLSDDPEEPWKFALADQSLAPGEYLIIYCDGDVDEGPNHADFRLNGDGEDLVLSTQDAILDEVSFEILSTNTSLGRTSDGLEAWDLCRLPSPAAPNACSGLGFPTPPGGVDLDNWIHMPSLERR